MNSTFPYRLYLVISEAACGNRNFLEVAEQAILGGVDIIQLREKDATVPAFLNKAARLKEITDRHNVPLIVNDNLQVAKHIGAAGIHVGNQDIPPTQIKQEWEKVNIIGYSIEYLQQLGNPNTAVSDYLGISPVFQTPTKKDTVTAWGLQGIERIRLLTAKPLVAIGNMNSGNAGDVIRAGADCIAVVSAICGAADPGAAASALRTSISNALAL